MSDKGIKKILETAIYEDTRTVSLMDKYEGYGRDVSYVQLVLRNIACLNIEGKYEYISLVVERSKDHRYVGDITFTELKQGFTRNLYEFMKKQISSEVVAEYKDSEKEFRFDTPYLFRAQNSTNRSGYGWGYGGTQYGETTAYVFVGAYIGYRSFGFSDRMNEMLETADMSEFSIKNKAENPSYYTPEYNTQEIIIEDQEFPEENNEIEFEDSVEVEINEDPPESDDFGIDFITEKRNIPDDEGKPFWFYSGFSMEINLFILALEQKIYLPPIIDECEKCMQTDENTQYDPEFVLTDMEKTFMFVEMLANAIGYSGVSVMGLDLVHKRKVLNNLLLRNIDSYEFGEYGDNSISFHLVADFLENQPELSYRGFVEIILSKYQDAKGYDRYELLGGFRDFGENEVEATERHYWTGKDRYLLDEGGNGSYLQGIYEMAVNY